MIILLPPPGNAFSARVRSAVSRKEELVRFEKLASNFSGRWQVLVYFTIREKELMFSFTEKVSEKLKRAGGAAA